LGFFAAAAAPAQRVALVLSGGGARGVVHLGVIKALEENGVPIDAIAGTSIGAIVGGMYAAGYTLDETKAYFRSADFKRWSSGSYESEGSYFFKKLDPDAEFFGLNVNIDRSFRGRVILPTNYILPYQMDFAFMQLFLGANAVAGSCFDSLMIPFRALSYNAYDKRAYAPARGDLGTVIRASMSVPGVFKPVMVDSFMLFDGGIINNFPVDVAVQEFAPDFIIGVKCADNYERPSEDNVFSHITSLAARPTSYDIPEEKGLLIDVDSLDVGLLDFSRVNELIKIGYEAATAQMPRIRERVRRRVAAEDVRRKREAFRRKMPERRFKGVTVQGGTPNLRSYVGDAMLGSRPREDARTRPEPALDGGMTSLYAGAVNALPKGRQHEFSLQEAKRRYFGVVSDGGVSTFFPTATYMPADSAYNLDLRISAAPNMRMSIGGCFSSSSNLGFVSVMHSYYSSIFSLRTMGNLYVGDVYGSQKLLLRADYPSAIGIPVFGELMYTHNNNDYYTNNPDNIFSDTRPDFIQDAESFGQLNLGAPFVLNSSIKAGGSFGSYSATYYAHKNFQSKDIPERMTFRFRAGHIAVEHNSMDLKMFETSGVLARFKLCYVTGSEYHTFGTTSVAVAEDSAMLETRRNMGNRNFWSIKYTHKAFFKPMKYLSLGYHIEGALSKPVLFSDYYSTLFLLPDFNPTHNMQGLFLENFRAASYLAGGLIPSVTFWDNVLRLRVEGYLFQPLTRLSKENIQEKVRYQKDVTNFSIMGAASLIVSTPAGALSGGVMYYDKPNRQVYFMIAFGYNLHNKRAF
jgi:NTE family protein